MSDMFGDDDSKKNKQDDFGSMLEASLGGLSVRVEKGDKVQAEVLTIGRDDIFLSVKGKDAIIAKMELLDDTGALKVKVGDTVELYVVKFKDNLIQLTSKASSKALSETLEDAFDFETAVEGKVTEAVNGGFRVEIMHKLAFCPMSQMDSKPIAKPEDYIGKKFNFIITKFEARGRNIVVSRRKLLDVERAENEGSFMDTHKVGQTVTGTVVRLENFGAFVQLESGVEGLVHISEIGWSRVAHPSEVVTVNDTIQAKILKIEEDDRGRLKVSLSKKQASEDPWFEAAKSITTGAHVDGKIKEKAHFGWLIEIKPGIVGLLPKSALKEATDEKSIEQKKIGETLKLIVMSVRPDEKRISLSLPGDQDDVSWQEFAGSTNKAPGKGMGTLGDQFASLMKKR